MMPPSADQQTEPMLRAGQVRWTSSLSFRLSLGLAVLFAVLIATVLLVLRFQGQPLVQEESYRRSQLLGETIIAKLTQRIKMAEVVATELALLSTQLPLEPASFRQMVPKMLDYPSMKREIAGGGIWPEANRFAPNVERRSFFWGRDEQGFLRYYDDYNAVDGPGYHHEEWYVPARYLAPDDVYWSKSYTDPYSQQPMVTCTVPVRRAGEFWGVTTVDLRLEGLSEFLVEQSAYTGGYAFALDRNNRFIAYPDLERVADVSDTGIQGFRTIHQMREAFPAFAPIADKVQLLERFQIAAGPASSQWQWLSERLADESYQIEEREAKVIAAGMAQSLHPQDVQELASFELKGDLILGQEVIVTVFEMSITNWKIVTVVPLSQAVATASSITRSLSFSLLLVLVVCAIISLLLMRWFVVRRLDAISAQVRHVVEAPDGLDLMLDENHADELGVVAYWFNRRTEQVRQNMIDLKRSNSELRQHEDELNEARLIAERASRAKTSFLANMSHELRTPLNAVLGFTNRIRKTSSSKLPQRQRDALDDIYRNAQHLMALINDVLDVSRVEAGELEIVTTSFNLAEVAAEVVRELNPLAEEQDLTLHCVGGVSGVMVDADRTRVKQIIYNLVSNGIKFTERGGVSVEWYQDTDEQGLSVAVVKITDTGIGINEDHYHMLFKEFSRLHRGNDTISGGTGLGLALSSQLAKLQGGVIRFNSKEGYGSQFWLELPLSQAVYIIEDSCEQPFGH